MIVRSRFSDLMLCVWYAAANFVLHDLPSLYSVSESSRVNFGLYDWDGDKVDLLSEKDKLMHTFRVADKMYTEYLDRLVESMVYVSLNPSEKTNFEGASEVLKKLYLKSRGNEDAKFLELTRDLDGMCPVEWKSKGLYEQWRENSLERLSKPSNDRNSNDDKDYKGAALASGSFGGSRAEGRTNDHRTTFDIVNGLKIKDGYGRKEKMKRETKSRRSDEHFPISNGSCLVRECKTRSRELSGTDPSEENDMGYFVGNPSLGRQYLSESARIPLTSDTEWTPFVANLPKSGTPLMEVNQNYVIDLATPAAMHKYLESGKYSFFEANEFQLFDGTISKRSSRETEGTDLSFLNGLRSQLKLTKYPLVGSVGTADYKDSVNKMLNAVDSYKRGLRKSIKYAASGAIEARNLQNNATKPNFDQPRATSRRKNPRTPWQKYKEVSSLAVKTKKKEIAYSKKAEIAFKELNSMEANLRAALVQSRLDNQAKKSPLDFKSNGEYQFEWHTGSEYGGSDTYVSNDVLCLINHDSLRPRGSSNQEYTLWLCYRSDLDRSALKLAEVLNAQKDPKTLMFDTLDNLKLVSGFDSIPSRAVAREAQKFVGLNGNSVTTSKNLFRGARLQELVDAEPSGSLLERWKSVEKRENTNSNSNETWSRSHETMDYGLQPTILIRLETIAVSTVSGKEVVYETNEKLEEHKPWTIWDLNNMPRFGDYSTWSECESSAIKASRTKIYDRKSYVETPGFNSPKEAYDVTWIAELGKTFPKSSWKIPLTSVLSPLYESLETKCTKYSSLTRSYSIRCKEMDSLGGELSFTVPTASSSEEGEEGSGNLVSFLSSNAGKYRRSLFHANGKSLQGVSYNEPLFSTTERNSGSRIVGPWTGFDVTDVSLARQGQGFGHYDFYLLSNLNDGISLPFQLEYKKSDLFLYEDDYDESVSPWAWTRPFLDAKVKSPILNSCDAPIYALFDAVKSIYLEIVKIDPINRYDWKKAFVWAKHAALKSSWNLLAGNRVDARPNLTSVFSAFDLKHVAHSWWSGNIHATNVNSDVTLASNVRRIWNSYYMSLIDEEDFRKICILLDPESPQYRTDSVDKFFQDCLETELLLLYVKDRWYAEKAVDTTSGYARHYSLSNKNNRTSLRHVVNSLATRSEVNSGNWYGLLDGSVSHLIRIYFKDVNSGSNVFVSEFGQFWPRLAKYCDDATPLRISKAFNSTNRVTLKPTFDKLARIFATAWIRNLTELKEDEEEDDANSISHLQSIYTAYLGFKNIKDSAVAMKMTNGREGKLPSNRPDIVRRTFAEVWKGQIKAGMSTFGTKFLDSTKPVEIRSKATQFWFSFVLNELKFAYKSGGESFADASLVLKNETEELFQALTYICNDEFLLQRALSGSFNLEFKLLENTDSVMITSLRKEVLSVASNYSKAAILESSTQMSDKGVSLLKDAFSFDSSDPNETYYRHEFVLEIAKSAMTFCTETAQTYVRDFNKRWAVLKSDLSSKLGGLELLEGISDVKVIEKREVPAVAMGKFNFDASLKDLKSLYLGRITAMEWNKMKELTDRVVARDERNVVKPKYWPDEPNNFKKVAIGDWHGYSRRDLYIQEQMNPNKDDSETNVNYKHTKSVLERNGRFDAQDGGKTVYQKQFTVEGILSSNKDPFSNARKEERQTLESVRKDCEALFDKLSPFGLDDVDSTLSRESLAYDLSKLPFALLDDPKTKLSMWTHEALSQIFPSSVFSKTEMLKSLEAWNLSIEEEKATSEDKRNMQLNYPVIDAWEYRSDQFSEKTFQHTLRHGLIPIWLEFATLMAYYETQYRIQFDPNSGAINPTNPQFDKFLEKRRKLVSNVNEATNAFLKYNNLK